MDYCLAVVFSLISCTQFFIQGSAQQAIDYGSYRHFIVVSNQGNDTESCLNSTSMEASIQNPCLTLDHAITAQIENATVIILEPGVHNLTTNATFQYISDFGLVGNGSYADVSINCSANASFSFVRSEDIKIQGLSFYHCGSLHNSTVGSVFGERYLHVSFYAGMFLAYVKNVTMVDCKITKSPGIGLSMYDVGGEVNIINSIFSRNSPDPGYDCSHYLSYTKAGGGFYVEFTYEGALPPFAKNDSERFAYQSNNNYIIEGCTFEENFAPEQCFENKIEFPSENDHMPFGRGGGLSFFVKGTTNNSNVVIQNCAFLNNQALWGAGFFVEFQDETQNNTLIINGSRFLNNGNSFTIAGGAVRSGLPIWEGKLLSNKILHEDCIYKNNTAMLGGGVSHYGPNFIPVNEDDRYRMVIFRRCTWNNNKATVGSAMGLATTVMDLAIDNISPSFKDPKLPYIVCLENCRVICNEIIKTEDGIVIGQGALYTYAVPVVLQGSTRFDSNQQTALVLDSAILKVFGNAWFTNNSGLQGGAIGMYGMSIIDLMPASNMDFKRNKVTGRGGAIYVDVSGPPVVAFNTTELNTHGCFLSYNDTTTMAKVEEWNTNLTFEANEASAGGGNSIYATTLQGCRRVGEKRTNSYSLQWDFIKYINKHGEKANIAEEISTDPIKIEINEKEWMRSPGEEFSASIKLLDEKDSLAQGVVNLSIDALEPEGVSLGTSSPLLLIKNIGQNHTEAVSGLMLRGQKHKMFNLTLRTVSGQTISTTNQNTLRLLDCHQGFHRPEKERECVCSKKQQIGISTCLDDKKTVYLKTGYWGGKVGATFETYSCPQGHCNPTTTDTSKREFQLEKKLMCAENRNSNIPLCGECLSNFTVALGSEKCINNDDCFKGNLWLLLVFFLLMLVFVLLVLKINIDIFTAYLNSWLYSYQIMGHLLMTNEQFDPVISVVMGLANWRLKGVGLCLYPGLTNFYKLGVNYILPFYVLMLLLVLSRVARYFPRCYINRNITHALCNLLVFCYTDITTISFNILHYVKFGDKWVLFSDGSIDFKEDWKTHLPFTILAIILLVFVALLPAVLVFTPWFFRKLPCLNRYLIFFDIFQNCFEDQERQRNNRWFAGFYFICRIWILLFALYLPLGPLKRSILEASCVLVLGIFLYLQPYNTRYGWLNTIDGVLLTNLCLVTVFSSALNSDAGDSTYKGLQILINVLAYVPLVYLLILCSVYVWNFLKDVCNTYQLLPDGEKTDDDSKSGDRLEEEERSERSPLLSWYVS